MTFALRTAARIAGVNTTAVASFDMKMVTRVPTPYTSKNSREQLPLAPRTATDATQSKTPCSRANSLRSIIPVRKR